MSGSRLVVPLQWERDASQWSKTSKAEGSGMGDHFSPTLRKMALAGRAREKG